MALEIRQKTCIVPAGTPQAAPVTFDLSMPPREVDAIELIVPPGPNGLVGFYVANSLQQIIPYDPGEWIVTSGEKMIWPLEGFINSGSWQLVAYNTGTQSHAVYVRFQVTMPKVANAGAPPPILSGSDLDSGAQVDTTTPDTVVITI